MSQTTTRKMLLKICRRQSKKWRWVLRAQKWWTAMPRIQRSTNRISSTKTHNSPRMLTIISRRRKHVSQGILPREAIPTPTAAASSIKRVASSCPADNSIRPSPPSTNKITTWLRTSDKNRPMLSTTRSRIHCNLSMTNKQRLIPLKNRKPKSKVPNWSKSFWHQLYRASTQPLVTIRTRRRKRVSTPRHSAITRCRLHLSEQKSKPYRVTHQKARLFRHSQWCKVCHAIIWMSELLVRTRPLSQGKIPRRGAWQPRISPASLLMVSTSAIVAQWLVELAIQTEKLIIKLLMARQILKSRRQIPDTPTKMTCWTRVNSILMRRTSNLPTRAWQICHHSQSCRAVVDPRSKTSRTMMTIIQTTWIAILMMTMMTCMDLPVFPAQATVRKRKAPCRSIRYPIHSKRNQKRIAKVAIIRLTITRAKIILNQPRDSKVQSRRNRWQRIWTCRVKMMMSTATRTLIDVRDGWKCNRSHLIILIMLALSVVYYKLFDLDFKNRLVMIDIVYCSWLPRYFF